MSLTRRMQRARQRANQVRDILCQRGSPAPLAGVEAPKPWMTAEAYDRCAPPGAPRDLHHAVCRTTGELWVRPIDRRYRGLPRRALKARRADLIDLVHTMGGEANQLPASLPLWYQVEYLENVVDFEANMPCGCADGATRAVAEA
jgi:hypothetical protein